MGAKAPPDWDADSPELQQNLAKVGARIERDAARRVIPKVAIAKSWQKDIMAGLAVGNPAFVGRFRGEPGLERCGVRVNHVAGTAPWDVAAELEAFETTLQRVVAGLDAKYPDADSLDADGLSAVIDLAAWAHAAWIRIHPFANGNGRTARLWANLLLMRYGLPPAVALRPRPGAGYGAAGAAAMRGRWRPTARVFRRLVRDFVSGGRAAGSAASVAARKSKPP